jgi:TetR/AcrR family transcriptional regulator
MRQARAIVVMLLGFAERNPGMTRVLIGDALVNENERLQTRINALLDKVEAAMKQALRIAATQENLKPDADFGALANLLRCYVVGRWEQYARSGFTREPLTQWPQQWPMLYFACLSQSGPPGA